MAFEKGHKKLGGRQKGQKNKRTLALEEIFEKADLNIPERIIELLEKEYIPRSDTHPGQGLSDSDKSKVLLELMQYLFPKRKPKDPDGDSEDSGIFIFKKAENE